MLAGEYTEYFGWEIHEYDTRVVAIAPDSSVHVFFGWSAWYDALYYAACSLNLTV
jgi:hypothetical protein